MTSPRSAPMTSMDLVDTMGSSPGSLARSCLSPDGKLVSTLHPPTNAVFQYSRKRQAYGTVAPHAVPAVKHVSGTTEEYAEEARKRWFKAYAEESQRQNSMSTSSKSKGKPIRPLGSSGENWQTEQTAGNWTWQSWRGWSATCRHNHEQHQKEVWEMEARNRWRSQQPESTWRVMPGDEPGS
eukprot:gnl/TRDRNA2_/TRDRNA2_200641_c0_seq1.p1 gnl/TRDRNA2_/TRDRNA2_200641_c0~~gnl/TRDRNA2_/TRDRNA2_200641_c0_seq1.p1  ORF type:complete len:208 (+),score=15.15 gnl/TRDRNA2_/TRDRNA2_200641_c0_seq1:80-625(+)